MTRTLRRLLRAGLRAAVSRVPLRGTGALVLKLDPWLRTAETEEGEVFGVPFRFDYRLDRLVARMYHGNYEPAEVRVIRREVREGDTVADVGANIGYLSAVAASAVGRGGRVLAFEPVPELYGRLSGLARDAAARGFRIEPRRVALGDREGEVEIRTSTRPNIGWATMVPGMMGADEVREVHRVPLRRLDDVVREEGVGRLGFVKIDVEGAERLVLEGMRDVLRRDRPVVLCEVCPWSQSLLGGTVAGLFEFLEGFGYRASRPGLLRERPLDPSAVRRTMNVLFRPGRS